MRLSTLTFALGFACLAGACAAPKATQVATGPTAAVAPGAEAEKVCITQEVTGSRLPTKECHTRDEWAALKASGAEDLPNRSQPDNPFAGNKSP